MHRIFASLILFCATFVVLPLPSSAAPITVPSGLNPGEQYRLAFVTSTTRDATSSNIADYNAFVTTAANSEPLLLALGTTWSAIASTPTTDARVTTSTDFGVVTTDASFPIYRLDGALVAASNLDLWDGTIGATISLDQSGHTPGVPQAVWTGTSPDGGSNSLHGLGNAAPVLGLDNVTGSTWVDWTTTLKANPERFFAISGVLTVVPEPSTGVLAVIACGMIWWWRKRSPLVASKIHHGASIRLRRLMLFVAAMLLIPAQIVWATPITLGVMGDSLSDEYSEQTYGAYAQSWTQQFVQYRGIDLGPTAAAAGQPGGTWGEPRRTGFEYNWARYGDTTGDLLAAGQPTGLAAQIGPKGINYAVLMIGSNDQLFDGNNAYQNIYSGAWSPAQINTWANGVASNIATALNTVAPTGVKMVLVNTADYGVAPYVNTVAVNAAGRQAVSDVLRTVLSPKIEALAAAQHLPFVDLLGALEAIYGPQTGLHSTLNIGNVAIQLQSLDSGANPTAGFVGDGIHPNTTIQGIIGNLVIEGLDIGYGANLSLFSEQEILAHKGLAYGGADTLTAQIGPYSAYVTNFVVPEPSSLVLAGFGIVGLLAAAARRKFVGHALECVTGSSRVFPWSRIGA